MGRDTPSIVYGAQRDFKKLMFSDEAGALTKPMTISAGYGELEAGTALALNASAAGNLGEYVPYNPTVFTGAEDHPGRAYLVQDGGQGASVVYVTLNDAYKFIVGDDLIINDDGTTAENLGAITAIDVTTYSHMAEITATTNITGAFGTANSAYVCVEAGDSSNNFSDCKGILMKAVDAGTGVNAQGALTRMIFKNAQLYTGMLVNVDAAARTDLSATEDGQLTYF